MEAHVAACGRCERFAGEYVALVRALRGLRGGAPDAVVARLGARVTNRAS